MFRLLLTQALVVLLLACAPNSLVEGIRTHPLAIVNTAQTSPSYALPVPSTTSPSYALAMTGIEWQGTTSWHLTLENVSPTSVNILLETNARNWTSISFILWTIDNSLIYSGFGSLSLTGTDAGRSTVVSEVGVGRAIRFENESIAVVFVVGVQMVPGGNPQFNIVPFRVFNSSIHLNITGLNIKEVQSIQLSFIIFSPGQANFQAFGGTLAAPPSPSPHHFDISATVPPTQYLIFGITGLDNHSLRLRISAKDYLLTVSNPGTTLQIAYLYLVPRRIECVGCPERSIYQEQCLAECPQGTIRVQFAGVRFCRNCPEELNQRFDQWARTCVCREGFVREGTECVKKFLPASLLVGLNALLQVKPAENVTLPENENQAFMNSSGGQPEVRSENQSKRQSFLPLGLAVTEPQRKEAQQRSNDRNITLNNVSALMVTAKPQLVGYSIENAIDQSLFEGDSDFTNTTVGDTSTDQYAINTTAETEVGNISQSQNSSFPSQDNLRPLLSQTNNLQRSDHNFSSESHRVASTTIFRESSTPTPTENNLSSSPMKNGSVHAVDVSPSKRGNMSDPQTEESKKISVQAPALINIAPLQVSTPISNQTINATECLSNSISVNGRCLCRLGFINISNLCTPLSQLVLSTGAPKTVKAVEVCPSSQIYSSQLQSCTCPEGQISSGKSSCVSACSTLQEYDFALKSCQCLADLTRIRGQCTKCRPLKTGTQECYPLAKQKACMSGYISSQGHCIKCTLVTNLTAADGTCRPCQGGLTYDGYGCTCPPGSDLVNDTCVRPTCGNSQIDSGETCDDGNLINGDGCSSQCLIQSGYSCQTVPRLCIKAVCGDGLVNGGEVCDDGNRQSGDGCSSVCLTEDNYTCLGVPSACFQGQSGNLTLTNLYVNANNVFVELKTASPLTLQNQIMTRTLFSIRFLGRDLLGTPYCQGSSSADRFSCLIIFPRGVPVSRTFVRFSYLWQGLTGSLIVELGEASWQWPSLSRRK